MYRYILYNDQYQSLLYVAFVSNPVKLIAFEKVASETWNLEGRGNVIIGEI